MARFLSRNKKEDSRPPVKDDFIYDEPKDAASDIASDTPEEALRKLRESLGAENVVLKG